MRYVLFLLVALFMISCASNKALQAELESAQSELEILRSAKEKKSQKQMYHIVFLKLKAGISSKEKMELVKTIDNLKFIESLNELHVGERADTGDERFISDHDLLFSLSVSSKEDYKLYREHPLHLELIKVAKGKLAGPPAVYDYWTN